MNALAWFLSGVIVTCVIMLLSRRNTPPIDTVSEAMRQQMLGEARMEGYCEGDRHGYARGLADGVRREREDAEWRANAIQQLIDTTKGRP